jgi:hypothetical protein
MKIHSPKTFLFFLLIFSVLLGTKTMLYAQKISTPSVTETTTKKQKKIQLSLYFLFNPIYDMGFGAEFTTTPNVHPKWSNNQLYIGTTQFGDDNPLKSTTYLGNRTTLYRSKNRDVSLTNNTVYRYLLPNESNAFIHQFSTYSELKKNVGKFTLLGGLNLPLLTKESDPTQFRLREVVRSPFTLAGVQYQLLSFVNVGLTQYRTNTFVTTLIGPLMFSYNLSDSNDNMLYFGTPWITY